MVHPFINVLFILCYSIWNCPFPFNEVKHWELLSFNRSMSALLFGIGLFSILLFLSSTFNTIIRGLLNLYKNNSIIIKKKISLLFFLIAQQWIELHCLHFFDSFRSYYFVFIFVFWSKCVVVLIDGKRVIIEVKRLVYIICLHCQCGHCMVFISISCLMHYLPIIIYSRSKNPYQYDCLVLIKVWNFSHRKWF